MFLSTIRSRCGTLRRPARSGRRARSAGFTLVELLVAISIVTILAATALFAMWGVQEDAKAARTRSQVAKINEFVMEKYESYRTRPIRMQITPTSNPRANALARLLALREILRMELPDRRTDLIDGHAVWTNATNPPLVNGQRILSVTPQLWQTYRRKVTAATGLAPPWQDPGPDGQWGVASVDDDGNGTVDDLSEFGSEGSDDLGWSPQHQGSECLYLILSMISDGETSALDFFMEGEIQDTDGDGMAEILDGWGRPIAFLRWAPGYVREATPSVETMQTVDASEAPDPFDPVRADVRWPPIDTDPSNDPFNLVPLIFSAGKDQIFDIFVDFAMPDEVHYRNTTPLPNDPFLPFTDPSSGSGIRLGTPVAGSDGEFNHGDNITNHFSEVP